MAHLGILRVAILAVFALAALVAIVAGIVYWMREHRRNRARSLPPLFFPMGSSSGSQALGMADPHWAESHPPAALPEPEPHRGNGHRPTPPAAVAPPPAETPPTPPSRVVIDVFDDETPVSTETVRFIRPVEEAVQLLPGRLEVIQGETSLREIFFVRVPGEPAQLILGRDAGPTPQYVGLRSTTVSRRHAHFLFTDGQWVVRNLSLTNPLVVNNEELTDTTSERVLADGDRLELGEVILRFHSH